MTYKVFELVKVEAVDEDNYAYALKDLNDVYEEKYLAERRIEDLKEYSFSMYTILEIY